MSDGLGSGGGEAGNDGLGEGGDKGNAGGLGDEAKKPEALVLPENWKESFPEELRGEKSLEKFKTVDALFKSYVHMEKSLGKNKVTIPDKFATDADWEEVYKQLGCPSDVTEYEIKIDAKAGMAEDFVAGMKELGIKNGYNQKQMQSVFNYIDTKNGEYALKHDENSKKVVQENLADLRVEWGNGYDRKMNDANTALTHFGGAEALEAIQDVGLQNNKHIIKMFSKLGDAMREDKIVHNSESFTQMTPEEALSQARDIRSNKDHPYNRKEHINHAKALQEVDNLYAAAYRKPG